MEFGILLLVKILVLVIARIGDLLFIREKLLICFESFESFELSGIMGLFLALLIGFGETDFFFSG